MRWADSADAPVRLFCLPHTGGGAALYRDWAGHLAPGADVLAVRLPGREKRFTETPYRRLDDLTGALADAVEPLLDRPYAWFGHSMGALIGYEMCRTLRARGVRPPGCSSPPAGAPRTCRPGSPPCTPRPGANSSTTCGS
ncbi:thioesterase II family protein [Streptomyces zhihengii]